MAEMDGGHSKPPQISEMFQKFALAFKTKTFEFFAEDEDPSTADDGLSLLDSAEEFITDQKVVVIKPDQTHTLPPPPPPPPPPSQPNTGPTNTHITQTLIPSLFATISSFEASYLQLQTAHVPFDEHSITVSDRALVSHLQKLADIKYFYRDFRNNPSFNLDFPSGSCLEAQVQENQTKLRTLETLVNRLQSDIDDKAVEVSVLRAKLDKIQRSNERLSKRMRGNSGSSCCEVLLSVRVFDSMLHYACRSMHAFTKLLIDLMKRGGWDLELAANSVRSGIDYVKKGHNRYALLSYVCLGMFRGFDSVSFGLGENGIVCNGNGNGDGSCESSSLKQLVEHVSGNPMEVLSRNPNCEFSKFCENKYQQLIHPTMESSIFSNLDPNEVVLNSWKSLSVFYESFVNMASSIWMLHKLAFSFNPAVEIFQVERGVEFSMVYMEDVTKRCILPGKTRPKVGFTVVPGFKIGKTVIQSQVYLTGMKCTE